MWEAICKGIPLGTRGGLLVALLGLSLLVSGVFGFRASINADDKKTKTIEKWLFGIVGGGGLLMLLVGFASVYCEMYVIPLANIHKRLKRPFDGSHSQLAQQAMKNRHDWMCSRR